MQMLLRLTNLAFELTHALDSGYAGKMSPAAVREHIKDGKVFDFLEESLKGDLDISLFYNDDRAELIAEWRSLSDTLDAARKFGVQNDGLCLLLAYVIQGIQTRSGSVAA